LLQLVQADFVPPAREITTDYSEGSTVSVTLHDGSTVRLSKVEKDYDPTDRRRVFADLQARQGRGEVPTGLLFVDQSGGDVHDMNATVDTPLAQVPYEKLCPGSTALDELQEAFR
jgi:2-oxoglutarate ferredoxin oxidoreductase subunit beta